MRPLAVRIGHTPDPDDAFLFYALTKGKLKIPGLRISECLEDIERLNQRAFQGELEMTAISVAAYPYCAQRYLILPTGASIGDGVGPLVVSKEPCPFPELRKLPVAVPGRFTTAALLLQLAIGPGNLVPVEFDQIPSAIEQGKVKAGVLIHEGQLTYSRWGLTKLLDLGSWWKQKTSLPVPLGINVVRRDLGSEAIQQLASCLAESLRYAFSHRKEALQYAVDFARGLDRKTTDRFVGMYVNRFSVDCRPEGACAIQRLLDWASQERLIPRRVPIEFAGERMANPVRWM